MDVPSKLRICVARADIASAVRRLAAELTRDYHDKNPLLIGVLKGAFVFLSDLVRQLDFPLDVDFLRVSSYGSGMETSGKVRVVQPFRAEVRGRNVLLVEDIIDTGLTANYLLGYLRKKKPVSVKLCALIDKPSRRQVPVTIDYLGLAVPDEFLVGYGLDFDEKLRNLPDICYLEKEA